MIVTTNLPVQSLFFKHWHTDDTEVGIIVAKARFERDQSGAFRPVGAAPALVTSDIFEGDPATGYILQEQEIAPAKAATDLLIKGIARSPEGAALPDWPVSVMIPERLAYTFQVRGPCQWQPSLGRWRLTNPSPVTEVPLTYALAYGGIAPGDEAEAPDIYEYNPAGVGYVNAKRLAAKEAFDAPQIGELAEFIAADVRADMTVHGVGPLAKAWLPRRSNAGTFDEEWQRVRHPRMPHDYSLRFWNCAPAEMQIDPFLQGHETITLTGFSHESEPLTVQLPGAGLSLVLTGDTTTEMQMTLDTVMIDVSDPDPDSHTIDILWRALIRDPGTYQKANIQSLRVG